MEEYTRNWVLSRKCKSLYDVEIPNLPPEIIEEILKRLPVKSLLKFRCVSKPWLYLISSPQFIKIHLNFSTTNPNFTNQRIIHTIIDPNFNLMHTSVNSFFPEHEITPTECPDQDRNFWVVGSCNGVMCLTVDDTNFSDPNMDFWVVGSCNGLICLAVDDRDIFLWNPSLRKSKKLPPLDVEINQSVYIVWGFGFNECDDDYKVVGIFSVVGKSGVYEYKVNIYSLKSDSWKRIEDFKGGNLFDQMLGKCASGKLHFTATDMDSRWNLFSLDLSSEVYGMVEQPNYGEGLHDESLGLMGGCICVLSTYLKTRADVWVLKEYNVKESWTKVCSVPYVNDPGNFFYVNPFLVLPNGEILLEMVGIDGEVFLGSIEKHFLVYNPKNNSFRSPEIPKIPLQQTCMLKVWFRFKWKTEEKCH